MEILATLNNSLSCGIVWNAYFRLSEMSKFSSEHDFVSLAKLNATPREEIFGMRLYGSQST